MAYEPSWLTAVDKANWAAHKTIFGDRACDSLWLRAYENRAGQAIVLARCPGCLSWDVITIEQLHGRDNTKHECGYEARKDWWNDHTA